MHDVIRQISDFSSKVKEANNALPSKSKQHRWNSLQTEASIFFSKSNFGGCGLYMMMCQANHATRAELYARGNSLHRHDANSDPPFSFFVLQQITTSFFLKKKRCHAVIVMLNNMQPSRLG
jgi:hypothetical protein